MIATLILNNQGIVEESYVGGGGWGLWPFIIIAILLNLAIIVVLVLLMTMGFFAIDSTLSSAVLSLI